MVPRGRKRFQIQASTTFNGHAQVEVRVKKDRKTFGSLLAKDGTLYWQKARKRFSEHLTWKQFDAIITERS